MMRIVLSFLAFPACSAAPNPQVLQQFLPPLSISNANSVINTNVIDEIRDIASEVVKNQENASGVESIEIIENQPTFASAGNDRYYQNGRWYYDPNPYKPSGGRFTDQQEKNYWDWWYQPKTEPKPVEPVEPVYVNSYWTNGPLPERKPDTAPVQPVQPSTWTPTNFYNQNQEMNAFFLMMLADNDNDDNNSKMDKLIPLLMLQDPSSMQSQNLFNNPLFYMSMMDDEERSSCDKKYNVDSDNQDEFDEKIGAILENNVGAPWGEEDFFDEDIAKIDYQYIGCLAQVEENKKDSNKDLLLPLMMSGMFNGAEGSYMNMDPMMFLLLQKSAGNGSKWSKNILPLLLASGNQPIDPAFLLLLLEEEACNIKHHIPDFFYAEVALVGEVLDKVTDKTRVKAHFIDNIPEYAACIAAADDDGHEDFIMLMMLSGMGMM